MVHQVAPLDEEGAFLLYLMRIDKNSLTCDENGKMVRKCESPGFKYGGAVK